MTTATTEWGRGTRMLDSCSRPSSCSTRHDLFGRQGAVHVAGEGHGALGEQRDALVGRARAGDQLDHVEAHRRQRGPTRRQPLRLLLAAPFELRGGPTLALEE